MPVGADHRGDDPDDDDVADRLPGEIGAALPKRRQPRERESDDDRADDRQKKGQRHFGKINRQIFLQEELEQKRHHQRRKQRRRGG